MDTMCKHLKTPCACHSGPTTPLSEQDKALVLSLVHGYLLSDRSSVQLVESHDRRRYRKGRRCFKVRPVLNYARRSFHTTSTLAALRCTTRMPNHNIENALEIAQTILRGGAAARL